MKSKTMKRVAPLAAIAVGFCAGSLALRSRAYAAQTAMATNANGSNQPSVSKNDGTAAVPSQQDPRPGAGTILVGELIKPLDAKKVKVGDPVECRLLQDLLYKGKIIVSHKARAWGHITEVAVKGKGHPGSEVGLVFEKLVMPDKSEVPFQYPAIIIALGAPIRSGVVPTTSPSDLPVQMTKGKDSGASVLGAVTDNAQLAGANMPSRSGAISAANRGVIGLRNVGLDNRNPGYSVIVAPKGNLRLDFDAQVVLQVVAPKK